MMRSVGSTKLLNPVSLSFENFKQLRPYDSFIKNLADPLRDLSTTFPRIGYIGRTYPQYIAICAEFDVISPTGAFAQVLRNSFGPTPSWIEFPGPRRLSKKQCNDQ